MSATLEHSDVGGTGTGRWAHVASFAWVNSRQEHEWRLMSIIKLLTLNGNIKLGKNRIWNLNYYVGYDREEIYFSLCIVVLESFWIVYVTVACLRYCDRIRCLTETQELFVVYQCQSGNTCQQHKGLTIYSIRPAVKTKQHSLMSRCVSSSGTPWYLGVHCNNAQQRSKTVHGRREGAGFWRWPYVESKSAHELWSI